MGKKTISLNLDDTGVEDDALISSILNPVPDQDLKGGQPKNKNIKGKKETVENNKTEKPKKTITLDLGEEVKSEIKLSDIEIEKPIKSPPKQKIKKGVDPFMKGRELSKMSKVAKLDDFFNISKDENANSLTHPKTKDYQVGKEEAEIKLQNIQTQISKINNKISKKGRNNVDAKYLDSLNKLLKKEKKYLSILNSFSKNNNNPKHYLPTPDVNNISPNSINNIQKDKIPDQYSIKKIGNSPPKKNKYLTPKTNNIVSEIDQEMERVNALLDLTEGEKGKYRGIKTEPIENYNDLGYQMVNNRNGFKNSNKQDFKNVNLQMNLDGIDYLPNMDINQLRKTDTKGKNKDNNSKKEVSPPKTMFSVKANLLALKERENMLARQKRKIQEKLEFKKKQILKAKQQEKEMRKIKALEEEKRRLFELDREVKRLDKLRYQQSLEMKNTMKQMTQKGILTQQNIDNIQKEEFQNQQHQKIQLSKNGYPIYQPFTYNFNSSNNRLNTPNNYNNKNRSNSPTLFTKLHRSMLNMGVGEQVIFNHKPDKVNKSDTTQSFNDKNNTKIPKVSNKGYKYIRKDFVDNENSWQDWKISHLQYFSNNKNDKNNKNDGGDKTNNTNNDGIPVFLYPYNDYLGYLNNWIICKNTDFNDKIISLDNKNNNNMGNNNIIGDSNMGDNNIMGKNNLLNAYKRDIYQKIPLEDRKTELCQYLGMKKREYLDTILEKGMGKILPINKEKSKITLLKIWYSCFEDGKLIISNGNNKIFSQKSEIIEMT